MPPYLVRPLDVPDQTWVRPFLETHNHSLVVVSRGQVHDASQLPGFAALQAASPVGLLTYRLYDDQCEIVTLHSALEGVGVGAALIAAVRQQATLAGARRLWLITTNDNLPALRFYQKRGFVLRAVYPGAMDVVRQIKPYVPLIGLDGIPLRDELELELWLS